jgi:transaldolase
MIRQAALLTKIAGNISVKIPVTNSKGVSTTPVVEELVKEGTRVNVTAVFSLKQATEMLEVLSPATSGILSVFAGRIADTGLDPIPHVRKIVEIRNELAPSISLLWASPREPLNFIHAVESGSDIITMTPALIQKVTAFGKDLEAFSLETVQMFTRDAKDSGFSL